MSTLSRLKRCTLGLRAACPSLPCLVSHLFKKPKKCWRHRLLTCTWNIERIPWLQKISSTSSRKNVQGFQWGKRCMQYVLLDDFCLSSGNSMMWPHSLTRWLAVRPSLWVVMKMINLESVSSWVHHDEKWITWRYDIVPREWSCWSCKVSSHNHKTSYLQL